MIYLKRKGYTKGIPINMLPLMNKSKDIHNCKVQTLQKIEIWLVSNITISAQLSLHLKLWYDMTMCSQNQYFGCGFLFLIVLPFHFVSFLVLLQPRVLYEKEERKKKRDDKIQLLWRSVSQLPRTQRYIHECFCELLCSIILSACLVWGL